MPFGTILDRSVLLTPLGWRRCGNNAVNLDVVGLDRAGKPQAARVQLGPSRTESRVAFVGTAAAAGDFAEASRLLLAMGNSVELREVIATGSASDLQFETFRMEGRPQPNPQQAESLWEELQALSVMAEHDRVVIKCTDGGGQGEQGHGGWLTHIENDGTASYCIVARRGLVKALRVDADAAMLAIANTCLHRKVEGRWELEADFTLLAMWLLDALRRAGIKRCAQYDSIQHSCFVFIDTVTADPPPLGPGRCAFLSSKTSREMRIEWTDPSWTPVVSGFLLSPDPSR